jgi:uncharacterized protein YbcI
MAMRGPFSDAVEEITGRKVIAFMSQVHLDPDMAAEIFVLSPNGEETPSDKSREKGSQAIGESA